MANKYDKKITDKYIVLRAKTDTTETMNVENGLAKSVHEYDTDTQAVEVIDKLNNNYVIGYGTMFDLRTLNKFGDTDLEYGEVSKLLKRMLPEEGKMSLEKYCELFEIEADTDAEKIYRLYETIKEVIKRYDIEKQIIGNSKKKFDLNAEQVKLVYKDIEDRLKPSDDNILSWVDDLDDDEPLEIEESSEWNELDEPEVEVLEVEDEFEPVEEIDSFDDEPMDELEDIDSFEDEPLDDINDIDSFEDELSEEPLEDLDKLEDIDSFEDEPEELDEIEDVEPLEELEDVEDVEPSDEVEEVESLEDEIEGYDTEDTEEDEGEGIQETIKPTDEFEMPDQQIINVEITEDDLEEVEEDLLDKADVMNELENIYFTYKDIGHFLWTKWMALQVSRSENETDVSDEFHIASAELEGNYLKEFYFHLRDDLHADMPEEMKEYSARTQIMGMCLDAVINKGASRIYSEMAEGMYIEYVLNQPDSRQAKELKDLEECIMREPEWQRVYEALFGHAGFPIEQIEVEETVYEPELTLDENVPEPDEEGMEFVEVNPEDFEPIKVKADEGFFQTENDTPSGEEDSMVDVPETTPVGNDAFLVEPIRSEDIFSADEIQEEPQPKEKKKKKHPILKAILWLCIIAIISGLSYFTYGFYIRNQALRTDNIKLSYELKDANKKVNDLMGMEEYKEREQDFDQYILRTYKSKNYRFTKSLIEAYYGKDVSKMSDTIAPIYKATLKLVK